MSIDMNNPASIRAWADVNRARHIPQLRALWKLFPQWRESIEEAMKGVAK